MASFLLLRRKRRHRYLRLGTHHCCGGQQGWEAAADVGELRRRRKLHTLLLGLLNQMFNKTGLLYHYALLFVDDGVELKHVRMSTDIMRGDRLRFLALFRLLSLSLNRRDHVDPEQQLILLLLQNLLLMLIAIEVTG